MRGTSHQGARCYQRIRSQFLTSSRVNTHGRSPECGRRSKARRPRSGSGTAYVPRGDRCRRSWLSTERPRRRPRIELSSFSILLIFSQPSNHVRHPPATPANPDRSRGDGRQAATHDRGRDRPTNPDAPAHHSRGPAVMPTSSASPFTRQCRSTESRSCLRPRAKRRACVPALASL